MVEIPDEVLARFVIDCAREWGEYNYDGGSQIGMGEYGQHVVDVDYSIADLDPKKCDVEYESDYYVHVTGLVHGEYKEKVLDAKYNPPGDAHPAEYKRHEAPVAVEMVMDLTNLGSVEIETEIA